ncbi:MAG TPA: hypothetical protein PKO06_09070 [Candidatus Ozemobacteraceae bacterium]|nr:hypothetical protein [Candidatus Ozemobacteraceae bacterium]
MDEDVNVTPPDLKEKPSKRDRHAKREFEAPKPKFDMEAEHRKFLMIMFGLFVIVLVVMLVMNQHVDFAMDGGM